MSTEGDVLQAGAALVTVGADAIAGRLPSAEDVFRAAAAAMVVYGDVTDLKRYIDDAAQHRSDELIAIAEEARLGPRP